MLVTFVFSSHHWLADNAREEAESKASPSPVHDLCFSKPQALPPCGDTCQLSTLLPQAWIWRRSALKDVECRLNSVWKCPDAHHLDPQVAQQCVEMPWCPSPRPPGMGLIAPLSCDYGKPRKTIWSGISQAIYCCTRHYSGSPCCWPGTSCTGISFSFGSYPLDWEVGSDVGSAQFLRTAQTNTLEWNLQLCFTAEPTSETWSPVIS